MQKVGEFQISRVVESEVPFIEPNVFLPDFTPDAFETATGFVPRRADAASGKLVFAFHRWTSAGDGHENRQDEESDPDDPFAKPRSWAGVTSRIVDN
ncbi:MAG TPA: hypothetical protein VMS64_06045 [Candidatus Methylomirabilis sp.]|nr:hypothetical protein [Candidatus Methylomirabilis sp.]